MKTIKQNKLLLAIISMIPLLLTACKKENNNFLHTDELIPITLSGFNASSEELIVKVGGIAFSSNLLSNNKFDQKRTYSFGAKDEEVKLTVNEKTTGKLVLEKTLKRTDGAAKVNFFYMDGKIVDMPEKPPVVADKISLIYMFQPTLTNYSDPVDIVVGKYFLTPQVFEEIIRAKNVKPNEFTQPVTFPTFSTARQDYHGVMTSVLFVVRIYKAGTDIPYMDGTSYTFSATNFTAPKPAASVASSKIYVFSESPSGTMMRFATRLEL